MSPGRTITYTVFPDQWHSISQPSKAAPTDHYWTLRTFGLEGAVSIPTDGTDIRWGGFILELACGLAEWAAEPDKSLKISPSEQANDVMVGVSGSRVRITSGGQAGELDHEATLALVNDWLRVIAAEIAAKAPSVLRIPGFEWAADRAEMNDRTFASLAADLDPFVPWWTD